MSASAASCRSLPAERLARVISLCSVVSSTTSTRSCKHLQHHEVLLLRAAAIARGLVVHEDLGHSGLNQLGKAHFRTLSARRQTNGLYVPPLGFRRLVEDHEVERNRIRSSRPAGPRFPRLLEASPAAPPRDGRSRRESSSSSPASMDWARRCRAPAPGRCVARACRYAAY